MQLLFAVGGPEADLPTYFRQSGMLATLVVMETSPTKPSLALLKVQVRLF